MYLLSRVFFSTTSADCSCCSLWGEKKLCPYETVVLEQWILPHRTLYFFHCYLAQSDISLPCGLFAAQVHHLTYVGIFKQIFSPREVCFIFGTTGLPADFTGPLILFPPFFLCAASLCPPHMSLFFMTRSLTVFHLPSELDSSLPHPPLTVYMPNLFIFCKMSAELNFQFLLPPLFFLLFQ